MKITARSDADALRRFLDFLLDVGVLPTHTTWTATLPCSAELQFDESGRVVALSIEELDTVGPYSPNVNLTPPAVSPSDGR